MKEAHSRGMISQEASGVGPLHQLPCLLCSLSLSLAPQTGGPNRGCQSLYHLCAHKSFSGDPGQQQYLGEALGVGKMSLPLP